MKSSAAIEAITHQIDQNAKRKYYITILFVYSVFVIAVILVFSIFFNKNQDILNNLLSTAVTFAGSIIFPSIYFHLSKSNKNNYIWFRRIVLIDFLSLRYHSTRHLYRMLIRIFASFTLFTVIVFLGPAIIKFTPGISFPNEAAGLFLAYCSFVFFASYGVIALPRMIALKTGKSSHSYFYWLQFYKSMIVSSPVFIYICFGLFFIINGFILVFTIKVPDIFNPVNFGTVVSLFGVWIALIIAMANDFLRNYNRLDKCYEDHTTYTLRKHIIDPNKFDYILLGMGNLGKIAGGFLLPEILKKQERELNEPMRYFECIIDRDYELRIFPRNVIVIEKDNALFEETRFDTNSGLTYGFINGKDLICEMANKKRLPSNLILFSINGDGGYLPILKLADYDKSRVIINTTSDHDMGLKLKMIIDREKPDNDITSPIIISTVEDSSTFSYLERNESTTIFPMHAGSIEGNSIATRLFTMVMNMNVNNKPIDKIQLFLIGNGKTIYYTLNVFIKLLSNVFTEQEIENLIEKQLIIITNDPAISEEIIPVVSKTDTYPQRYQWTLHFDKQKSFIIKLIFQDPAGYHTILNAFEWKKTFNSNEATEDLIIFTTRNANDGIRICQHIKQITNFYKLNKIGILASISIEIANDIESLLGELQPLKTYLDHYEGFPSEVKDVIIKKNLIIGSQIISISDSLKNTFTSESDDSFLYDSISGEIALCISDHPGSFCKLLTRISGLSDPVISKERHLLPSFYNNYTFTLRLKDNEDKHLFVFRGDVYLHEIKNNIKPLQIHGYTLNGAAVFRKELRSLLENIKPGAAGKSNTPDCGYNNRCAVSVVSDSHCTNNNEVTPELSNPQNFATIKILADCDHVQGSLAVAIADFLMIGEKLSFNEKAINDKSVDIVYENCSKCHQSYKSINRLYVNIRAPKNHRIEQLRLQYLQGYNLNLTKKEIQYLKKMEKTFLYKEVERKINMKNLLINRNIIAIKIKPVKYANDDWQHYGEDLLKYLNGLTSFHSYTRLNQVPEITIFDKNVNGDLLDYIKNDL